jgi:parallel beta-helix repeat protein
LQFNTLTNRAPRHTDNPTSPVDIVAANGWRVADNWVSNFTKAGGNGVSYGIFMKGAGQGGRIERNLVVCSASDLSGPGVRVGISFGGGGSAPDFCRDRRCDMEHSGGLIANNVVAHCNDFGIDVFRSDRTVVTHNTLVNTAGIDVRRAPASASVVAHVLDGRIRQRDGGQATLQSNLVAALPEWMSAPDRLDLRWLAMPDPVGLPVVVDDDFCADRPSRVRLPGALGARPACAP